MVIPPTHSVLTLDMLVLGDTSNKSMLPGIPRTNFNSSEDECPFLNTLPTKAQLDENFHDIIDKTPQTHDILTPDISYLSTYSSEGSLNLSSFLTWNGEDCLSPSLIVPSVDDNETPESVFLDTTPCINDITTPDISIVSCISEEMQSDNPTRAQVEGYIESQTYNPGILSEQNIYLQSPYDY